MAASRDTPRTDISCSFAIATICDCAWTSVRADVRPSSLPATDGVPEDATSTRTVSSGGYLPARQARWRGVNCAVGVGGTLRSHAVRAAAERGQWSWAQADFRQGAASTCSATRSSWLTALKTVDRCSDLPAVRTEWARTVQRFAGLWHADLADASQIARLRRNVFFAAWVLAVSATVGTALTDSAASHQLRLVQYGSLLVEAVMGLATVLWGARMGDFAFSLLLYAGLAMAALGVTAHSHPGDLARTGMLFVPNMIMGAIFLEGRRWVTCHAGLVTVILVVLSGLNPEAGNIVFDLSTTATGLVTVAVSVRILRDLAVRAVVDARRGEVTDPLTGLLNRRGMERVVDDYWRDHARVDTPVLALMVDVDHFKAINDTQGHAGGDEVLRRLGGLLASSVRGHDFAVRMGGEEFLILCEAPPGQGQRIAERLRRTVEEELSPVTVSIGVHEVCPQATDVLPDAVWSAVQVADRSLYEAKRRGRNCVALALEGPETPL